MGYGHVAGDLRLHPDGTADGWCWAPSQPSARLHFEILVDERVVAGGEAALPRPDLSGHGMADTRHGFWLALPRGAIDRGAACLVSARARDGGVVFGRRLLEPARPPGPEPREAALAAELGAVSERLAALAARPRGPSPAGRLRDAARALGAALPAHGVRWEPGVAAARRVLARDLAGLDLPRGLAGVAMPLASLVLRAGPAVAATLERLRALAPAARAMPAELVLLDGLLDDPPEDGAEDGGAEEGGAEDGWADARHALLPALLPGLRLLRAKRAAPGGGLAAAAGAARGEWLLLLDAAGPVSAAGLGWTLARLRAEGADLALSSRLPEAAGLPAIAGVLPAGLSLACRRALVRDGDGVASLLGRVRGAAGVCVALAEPWAAEPWAAEPWAAEPWAAGSWPPG